MVAIPGRPDAFIARGNGLEAPDATGSRNLAALGRAGDQLFAAALYLQEQNDHTLLAEAQNAYSQGMAAWRLNVEQSRQGAAGQGVTKDFAAHHREMVADIEERMRERGLSGNGRRAFGIWAQGRETVGGENAARYEHKQMQLHAQDMHGLRLQSIAEGLEANPAAYKDAYQQLEESFVMAVGQGIYRPEEAKLKFADARDKLKAAAFENLYAVNRGAAMGRMAEIGLSPVEQARAKKRYQADVRADAAAARAANADKVRLLSGQVEDVDYLASQTGDSRDLRQLAADLGALGEDKMALKLSRRADLYENNAAAIKESRELSLPDLAAKIAGMGAKLEGAAAASDAAGHQRLSEELKLRASIFDERRKALAADPAGAVALQAERALPDGVADDARLRSEARLVAQENNGVPQGLRKVLTGEEAARLGRAWQDGDLETRLGLVEHINSYGPHAARAAKEVGLAPAEQLLALQSRRDPRAAGNLAAVIAATAAKPDDLPKLEKADSLAREAAESSQVVKAAKAASALMPSLPDLGVVARNYEDTLGRLVRLKGGDAASAVSMLDGRLRSMADSGNFALLYDPYVLPGDALEDGLRAAMNGPALEELAAARPFTDDFERADWLAHMRRSGVWLNAPDGEGYILFDPVAQAPAMDGQGSVLRVTDKDVTAARQQRFTERRAQESEAREQEMGWSE